MKKKKKFSVFSWVATSAFGIAILLVVLSMSGTVSEIKDAAIAKTPDAILASMGVSGDKTISIPIVYYDQRADECVDLYDLSLQNALEARQFEWTSCGYYDKGVEQGLVDYNLDKDYLPIGIKGEAVSNRGMSDLGRWFNKVEGKSTSYSGTLKMGYNPALTEFSFVAEEFYPIDGAKFSDGDFVNSDGHNHLFTLNLAVPFTVLNSGEEEFSITADDDTFVFIDNKLAIDMGGVHEAVSGRLLITKDGEVFSGVGEESLAYTGIKLEKEKGAIIRVFHADRDSTESVFSFRFTKMNLNVMDTKIASGESEIQVAYDPENPDYIPPLGVSKVFRPDSTRGLVIMLIIEGALLIIVAILFTVAVRYGLDALRRKKQ